MANYFVAYDLYSQGQNYPKMEAAVKACGAAVKMLNTTWYLKSSMSTAAIRDAMLAAGDANDRVLVIAATEAQWGHMPEAVSNAVIGQWNN